MCSFRNVSDISAYTEVFYHSKTVVSRHEKTRPYDNWSQKILVFNILYEFILHRLLVQRVNRRIALHSMSVFRNSIVFYKLPTSGISRSILFGVYVIFLVFFCEKFYMIIFLLKKENNILCLGYNNEYIKKCCLHIYQPLFILWCCFYCAASTEPLVI